MKSHKVNRAAESLSLQARIGRARNYLRQPHVIMSMLLLLILTFLVIIPVVKMFYTTFVWQMEDTRLSRAAEPGSFTLFHWKRVFASVLSNTMLWTPLKNSIMTGTRSFVFCPYDRHFSCMACRKI